MRGIKENVAEQKKRGNLPSMDKQKGKVRWRVTYASGEQEEFMTAQKVREKVEERNAVKVERKKFVVVLNGSSEKDFVLQGVTDWTDVSQRYLERN